MALSLCFIVIGATFFFLINMEAKMAYVIRFDCSYNDSGGYWNGVERNEKGRMVKELFVKDLCDVRFDKRFWFRCQAQKEMQNISNWRDKFSSGKLKIEWVDNGKMGWLFGCKARCCCSEGGRFSCCTDFPCFPPAPPKRWCCGCGEVRERKQIYYVFRKKPDMAREYYSYKMQNGLMVFCSNYPDASNYQTYYEAMDILRDCEWTGHVEYGIEVRDVRL